MKRLLLSSCVFLLPLLSSVAFAAGLIPVAVFPPVADKKVPEGLSLALQERATAMLASTGHFAVTDARQIFNMAEHHGTRLETLNDPNVAREAAQRLGVQLFVFSKLTQIKEGWTLDLSASSVGDPTTQASSPILAKGEAAAVSAGGQNLAVAIIKLGKVQDAVPPSAVVLEAKDSAVRDWAACEGMLSRQPIGVENPTVFNAAEMTRAIGLCGAAVKASPKLAEAWAALALAAAISGNDERAIFALTQAKTLAASLSMPNATLARFWLVTRYQSAEAGEAVLKEAILREPSFLLARSYYAELLNTLGKHAEAAKAWQDYALVAPNNPFIVSRLAYTLARLGKAAEAAKVAEKALAFDPDSVELNLELASRYLDAGQVDKAIATLEPLAKPTDARAEVVLRLGYAKLLKGEFDEAGRLFARAHAAAKAPSEWRTRARARLDLSVVALKHDKKAEAKKLFAEAAQEGLKLVPTPETQEVFALFSADELAALQAKGKSTVKEASPFAIKGGEVDTAATRPPAPKGFDDVKVK